MFTVCPKCTLTLVVTTVDLRAGQGYVRCGRCANVFNALIALREGDPNGSVGDTASRRLQETAPMPPVNPAVGAGVADQEPEPEPQPEPESSAAESANEADPSAEFVAEAETHIEPAAEQHEPEHHEPEQHETETEIVLAGEPEEASLEFDAAATDVSEIFISPSEAETTGSGTYETVVLGEEAPAEPEPVVELEAVPHDIAHTDTIAADEWSLLDDEPGADAESVIEESPLIDQHAAEDSTEDTMAAPTQPDPPWVEEMFAEAEAEAERGRTAEREVFQPEPIEEAVDDDAVVDVARASTGAAPPSDTAMVATLEPLLAEPPRPRAHWSYVAGIVALALALMVQLLHFNRQNLVLNDSFGPSVTTVYKWFGVTLTPRWDLTAYSVKQLGAEAEGDEGTQLRVRLSLQNDSQRVQPLPLLRLTLQDRYGNAVATRDLEPGDYLPPRAVGLRLLEPDQRIDAELHVIDPGRAAIGFEIDACLKGEGGVIGCANDARRRTAG